PVDLKMRPPDSAISGSVTSRRSDARAAMAERSFASARREKPTTSAAMMTASRRLALSGVIPILRSRHRAGGPMAGTICLSLRRYEWEEIGAGACPVALSIRSEEHTSELQSREKVVCPLLLGKKNRK